MLSYSESISACIFCDSAKDIVSYRGKNVCSDCIRMLEEKI